MLALRALQADHGQTSDAQSQNQSDLDFQKKPENATKANPYAGLYSDELPQSFLGDQSEENDHANHETQSLDGERDLPSRGSDAVSESQSVAEDGGSNDYAAEGFVEDEF